MLRTIISISESTARRFLKDCLDILILCLASFKSILLLLAASRVFEEISSIPLKWLGFLAFSEIVNKLDLDERIFSLEVLNHIFKSVNFELLIESASSTQRFNEASMPWNLEVKNHENKVLIMSSLLLLALFAIRSYSADWDNPEGQSADQMIAGPDQGMVIPQSGPVETPQSSRAAEIGQSGKDILSAPSR